MFDKLEDLRIRLDEILNELQEPDVANDQNRFRKLMKEQNDLTPIVEAYNEYKECKQAIEDSLEMLEEESDEEMRELAKEELNDNKKRVEELENSTTWKVGRVITCIPRKIKKTVKKSILFCKIPAALHVIDVKCI